MLSNKSLKCAFFLALLLGSMAVLSAWSITDSYFGNPYGAFDPRSFAMGSTGAFGDQSPFAIAINPANLTLMKKHFGAQASMNYTRNEDNRAVPLYNSFDNYVDDAVYSSNINAYDDYAAMVYGSLHSLGRRAGFAVYHKPLLSFDGDYNEQIRNNYGTDNDIYPEIIALNQIKNTGTLNQTGFAYSIGNRFGENVEANFGVDFSLLSGEIMQRRSIQWTDVARQTVQIVNPSFMLPNQIETMETKLDGSQFKLGSTFQLGKRLGIGLVYTNKATLDHKGSYTIDHSASNTADSLYVINDISEDYILPSQLRLGISYRPQNIMRTWFNLDIERVNWSDIHTAYDDVFNLYAGVEHHVENRIPLRIGFQALSTYLLEYETLNINGTDSPVYVAHKIITPMITAGSSIELVHNVKLDLGFGYAWREYNALDMFGDSFYNDKIHTGHSTSLLWRNPQYLSFTDRGWENPDKVRESFITLSTGLTFTW